MSTPKTPRSRKAPVKTTVAPTSELNTKITLEHKLSVALSDPTEKLVFFLIEAERVMETYLRRDPFAPHADQDALEQHIAQVRTELYTRYAEGGAQ